MQLKQKFLQKFDKMRKTKNHRSNDPDSGGCNSG